MPDRAARTVHAGIALCVRIRSAAAAGEALPANDVRQLAHAINLAIGADGKGNRTIDAALGLRPGWQANLRETIAADCGTAGANRAGSMLQRARIRHAELAHYEATRFRSDLGAAVRPTGERGLMFDYLSAHGGRVPSVRTLRRELANNPPPRGQRDGASSAQSQRQPRAKIDGQGLARSLRQ